MVAPPRFTRLYFCARALTLLSLVGLLLVRCDDAKSTVRSRPATGTIGVVLQGPPTGSTAAAKVVLTRGWVRVSGEGMAPLDTVLAVQGGVMEGVIGP